MKHIIVLLTVLSINCNYSRIIYGFPDSDYDIKGGDLIIANIPTHLDGKFIDSQPMDSLISLVNHNINLDYSIEIHYFYLDSTFNRIYSESLKSSLNTILSKSSKFNNYSIIAQADTKPIFLDKNNPIYKQINTRFEIFVKEK